MVHTNNGLTAFDYFFSKLLSFENIFSYKSAFASYSI